jgi:hypothetical protein
MKERALEPVQNRAIPTDHELTVFRTMAKHAAESQMYKTIGREADVMMRMLAARELGIPPMQALNGGLRIIEGNMEISARMMNAMIRRAKHKIIIVESTDERCTLKGVRADNGDTATVTYSVEDAARAGLIKEKGGWKKVPADMCFARALSRLARQLFADVIGIGYVEGEISDAIPEPLQEDELQEVVLEPAEPSADTAYIYQLEHFEDYVTSIMTHYEWTREKVVSELNKTSLDKILTRFETWKINKSLR